MTRSTIAGGAIVTGLVLLALAAGYRFVARDSEPVAGVSAPPAPAGIQLALPSTAPSGSVTDAAHGGFLYGRITTRSGATVEGRLRWGGTQEAFWDDLFNGVRSSNPWAVHVPPPPPRQERRPLSLFGLELGGRAHTPELRRPFQVPFGALARLEADGVHVRATLKSGALVDLDRLDAGDFDDGVSVWNERGGVVELEPLQIHAIDFLPTPRLGAAPARRHGTVRTRQREFTGFIAWERDGSVGSDEIEGRSAAGKVALRLDTLRSIARRAPAGLTVTLRDGREIVLTERGHGPARTAVSVADPRYGRVSISRDSFERVDFDDPAEPASGPAYGDFAPGRPLAGSVTTRDGRRLSGRLVFDLDESETDETLDASSQGVDYNLSFDRIAAIDLSAGKEGGEPGARVTLLDGEELRFERNGDLGERNGGLLIFAGDREHPDYVPWIDTQRIDLDRPSERSR